MTRLVSKIYGLGPGNYDHEGAFARIWRMSRKAWRDHGTLVIKPKELPPELGAALTAWANEQYGEGRHGR